MAWFNKPFAAESRVDRRLALARGAVFPMTFRPIARSRRAGRLDQAPLAQVRVPFPVVRVEAASLPGKC
jgi:hypothetical protein